MPYLRVGSRVLDVGCADGAMFRRLGDRVGSGVGIDPDAVPGEAPNFRMVRGQFPDGLPDDEPFDKITVLAVLEHIPEEAQPSFAECCFRLLKPGGKVVVTVPNPAVDRIIDVLVWLRLLDGMSLEEHWGFVPDRAEAVFQAAGFTTEVASRFQFGLNNLFVFTRPDAGSA